MRDLHLGYAMLEQVDAVPALFRKLLKLDIAAPAFRAQIAGYDIRLSQILLTALARYALDGRLVIEPIEAHRLEQARAAIMTIGATAGAAQRRLQASRGYGDARGTRRTAAPAQCGFRQFMFEHD